MEGDRLTRWRRHDGLGLGRFAARRNASQLGDVHVTTPPAGGPGYEATIAVPRHARPMSSPPSGWLRQLVDSIRHRRVGTPPAARGRPVDGPSTTAGRGADGAAVPVLPGFGEAANQAANLPAVVLSLAIAGAVYRVAQPWWSGVGNASRVVPTFYVLVVLGALLCVTLLGARARLIGDARAAWVATGIAICSLAALGQAATVVGLASTPLHADSDGFAALYLLWHAALVVFPVGAIVAPRAVRVRWAMVGIFAVGIGAAYADPVVSILPALVDTTGTFTDLYKVARSVLTVTTIVTVGLWIVANGRHPTRPAVWIAVGLGLASADLVVAAGAAHLYASIWWSSAALRAAQFVVPATGLLADALRLIGLLHRHERSLTERLEHTRRLPQRLNHHSGRSGSREEAQRIRAVLDQRAYRTVFQPIYALETGDLVAVEALTRFTAVPQRSPDRWFDEATRCGLGTDLELATLAAALDHADRLPDGVALSVNLSPATLTDQRLHQHLDAAHPDPGALIIEITEHAAVHDYGALTRALADLDPYGVRVAIDDAGAGFSSLHHIVKLTPDIIKLDMSLTRDIHLDPLRRALAASLCDFARQMGIDLIAEGVETPAELHTLQAIGAHAAQGYLLAPPGDLPVPPTSAHAIPTPRVIASA